jgi:putative adenylate-forming enzyme
MKIGPIVTLVRAYIRGRNLDQIADATILQSLQDRWLARLQRNVTARSAYYRALAQQPFHSWPVLNKAVWMERFDDINTVGARLDEVMELALQSEQTRNFSTTWRGLTVGLSTGTSGHRGLFLISQREKAMWAGTLLAKLLGRNILGTERIALVLRAGSTLYDRISALRLKFRFVDQAQPWEKITAALEHFDPTVLVAPARVLRLLAESSYAGRPRRIISAAEVLDDIDRSRIEAVFGVRVEQIYQATEGLLGITCHHGTMHLNEPYVLIEKEWLDAEHTRFVPIVTDLWRTAQPVIRYRMNDVLRVHAGCACGRAATAIDAIEGRIDDLLWLDGPRGPVPIFPDLLSRVIVAALPSLSDYEVLEQSRGRWRIGLLPLPAKVDQTRLERQCTLMVKGVGAHPPQIEICLLCVTPLVAKQRRIRGAATISGAGAERIGAYERAGGH